jgi:hypothetical protein
MQLGRCSYTEQISCHPDSIPVRFHEFLMWYDQADAILLSAIWFKSYYHTLYCTSAFVNPFWVLASRVAFAHLPRYAHAYGPYHTTNRPVQSLAKRSTFRHQERTKRPRKARKQEKDVFSNIMSISRNIGQSFNWHVPSMNVKCYEKERCFQLLFLTFCLFIVEMLRSASFSVVIECKEQTSSHLVHYIWTILGHFTITIFIAIIER